MLIEARRGLRHPYVLLTLRDVPLTEFLTKILFGNQKHCGDGRSIDHISGGVNAICSTVSVFLMVCGIMSVCSPGCSVVPGLFRRDE